MARPLNVLALRRQGVEHQGVWHQGGTCYQIESNHNQQFSNTVLSKENLRHSFGLEPEINLYEKHFTRESAYLFRKTISSLLVIITLILQ